MLIDAIDQNGFQAARLQRMLHMDREEEKTKTINPEGSFSERQTDRGQTESTSLTSKSAEES